MLRVTVRLHKKLLMWLWVGFVRLEVNIWLQADHMDQDPLQHVVDDFFFLFFYLFTIQTDAVAVLSSLHSSQTTHIWWSVSELRCWFFWIFFFCSFSFSKLLKYYRNLCDKNSLRQEKYKKKKKKVKDQQHSSAYSLHCVWPPFNPLEEPRAVFPPAALDLHHSSDMHFWRL